MDTPTPKHCPSCGTVLGHDADGLTDGLCPRCLLASSLQSTISGEPASSPPPPVEEVAAAFPDLEILEMIGRGGMGAVYKARQKSLDRLVALKILPRSLAAAAGFAKRFEAEAKALATLNHPNIVTVHEFGHRDEFYFLLMEFVDGPNLRSLLVDHRMSPEEALTIIPRVCEALEYAHRRNVVHCDIKPENLLLNTEGQVKIADFGIARILGQTGADPDSDKAAGTPAYMAPEQIDNPRDIDTRADIYSLGVVFYEMLTGERPNHELTPPSGKNSSVDVRLDEIVLRALNANPQGRWQSANELNGELQTFLNERLGEPKVTPPEKLPKSTPLLAWLACGLSMAALVVFILAAIASNHIDPLPKGEQQAAIDRYFENLLQQHDLNEQIKVLDRKEQKTAEDRRRIEDLGDEQWEMLKALPVRELKAVSGPLLPEDPHAMTVAASVLLGLIGIVLGIRHLSWLRGQKEPLPGLKPAVVAVVLCPLVAAFLLLLPVLDGLSAPVFSQTSLWGNAGIVSVLLLAGVWGTRRLVAWSRNFRHAPPFRPALLAATVLLGFSIALPLTLGQRAFRYSHSSELVDAYQDAAEQQQFAFLRIKVDFDKEGPIRYHPEEEVMAARDAVEAHSDSYQALTLSHHRLFNLAYPEGEDRIMMFAIPPVTLLMFFLILWKFRPRRTR